MGHYVFNKLNDVSISTKELNLSKTSFKEILEAESTETNSLIANVILEDFDTAHSVPNIRFVSLFSFYLDYLFTVITSNNSKNSDCVLGL